MNGLLVPETMNKNGDDQRKKDEKEKEREMNRLRAEEKKKVLRMRKLDSYSLIRMDQVLLKTNTFVGVLLFYDFYL